MAGRIKLARLGGALVLALLALVGSSAVTATPTRILFVGNSFTFAFGSPVRFYRSGSVTDLNRLGLGGMPALFKSFTVEAGLDYDVSLETQPGVGLDWHLAHRGGVIAQQPWDAVVMHGHSKLDADRPGDPGVLVDSARRMAELLRGRNPAVEIFLMATWPRADQTYEPKGAWYGKPIEAMARDVRAGYDRAAAAVPGARPVVPVGGAFIRAMHAGLADPNPYDGIEAGRIDLWTYDAYHASTFGYYLEALVVFGAVTGRDPRSLGPDECAGFELGLSPRQVRDLEQVAFDELAAAGPLQGAPRVFVEPGEPSRCTPLR